MEQIKSQVEFLKRLYLLKGTVNSIAERAEFWMKEDEASIPFSHRLMRSPLTQKLGREIIEWSLDAAQMLGNYVDDDRLSDLRLLQSLVFLSLEEPPKDGNLNVYTSDATILDLNTLEFAARTLSVIVDDIFDDLFLEQSWFENGDDSDSIAQYLSMVDQELRDLVYWLEKSLTTSETSCSPPKCRWQTNQRTACEPC